MKEVVKVLANTFLADFLLYKIQNWCRFTSIHIFVYSHVYLNIVNAKIHLRMLNTYTEWKTSMCLLVSCDSYTGIARISDASLRDLEALRL